jgi:hypothetical protein
MYEDFKVVEIDMPQYGERDKITSLIRECFSLSDAGWNLIELRERHVMRHDQRDGDRKQFIGWLLILVK